MRIILLFLFVLNLFAEANITKEMNVSDSNVSEMDYGQTVFSLDLNQSKEENISDEVMDNTDEFYINIAIIMDKKQLFQFIPNILNSMNAYMMDKDIGYHIKLFDKDENLTKELNEITPNYKYIFAFVTKTDEVKTFNNYPNNYFFIPTLNKNQILFKTENNIYFSGINYKNQVNKLNQFVTGYTNIIYEDNDLSQYITKIISSSLLEPKKLYKYPVKYLKDKFQDTFVYLNTKLVNTAQILSNFTYYKIDTKSILTTQIDYSPLLFSLTNPDDIRNLIVTNSILNIPLRIEDNNLNLGSNIDFNWLDFTTSTLLNVVYNIETDDDKYFLNDFNLYMFFNQVNYKTNLYKIFKNGFIKIED